MKRSGLWALALAGAVVAVWLGRPRAGLELAGPKPPPIAGGPVERSVPASAAVATDDSTLAALLADPAGPKEIHLLPRTYHGDWHVTRPVSLLGERGATLEGSGKETVVFVEADDVTIDNVVIRHSGRRHTHEDSGIKVHGARAHITHVDVSDTLFGISLGPCPHCVLEETTIEGPGDDAELRGDAIKLWEANDAVVRNNLVERSRDVVVWYSRHVLVEGNTVRHGRYGTHFMYSHDSTARNNRILDNVVGIFVMYSERLRVEDNVLAGARGAAGVGIGFKDSSDVELSRNWLIANTTGTYLDRTPMTASHPVTFRGNVVALNDVAVRIHSSQEGLRFFGNDFHENVGLVDVEGGGDALGTTFLGNHWSDYVGYDLDDDGIGDVAYEQKRLSGELLDAHPSLQLFQGTGAMGLVDAISRAVPVLASHRLLVDPKPVMRLLRGGSAAAAPRGELALREDSP